MDHPLDKDQRYTYADYCTWDDNVRRELIDGVVYDMSAPTWEHQGISMSLSRQLSTFLQGKACNVFAAPFDVRLNANENDDTVVQPDVVVICDRSKQSGTGCVGSPDMVVEILSPASQRRDRLEKLRLYQRFGVREYWIVDPEYKTVSVHLLEGGKYMISVFGDEGAVPIHILESCEIYLQEVFSV